MNIQIKKLEPSLLEDYLYFCENTAHSDNQEFAGCYCVNYYGKYKITEDDLKVDFTSPEVRREFAIKFVNNGNLQGYLAYDDDRVVGWCNANNRVDCLECWGFHEYKNNISIGKKTKSIFCFAIAPDMRGKGIATALLKRVCDDAKKEGYECIEAYPKKVGNDVYYNFHGPIALYEKFDFIVIKDMDTSMIVRKLLK